MYTPSITDKEAASSPLGLGSIFPLRVSSKQTSFLSLVEPGEAQVLGVAATAVTDCRETSIDDQWPLINTIPREVMDGALYDNKKNDSCGAPESLDAYQTSVSNRESLGSLSTKAITSIYAEETKNEEQGFRTKQASDQASRVGEGMMLKISEEAEALLLGKDTSSLLDTTVEKKEVKRHAISMMAMRTASRLSASISRPPTPYANDRKASYNSATAERELNQLLTHEGMKRHTADTHSEPPRKSKFTTRKHPIPVGSVPDVSVPTIPSHSLAALSSSATAVKSKIAPMLAPSSRIQITSASLRNERMMDQRANPRKVGDIPKQQTKPHNTSHTTDKRSVADKKIKPQRSLKDIIFHKRASEEKASPVPPIPKRLFKKSSFIENTLGGRFPKISQKGVEERGRHLANPGGQVPPQMTHDDPDLANTQTPLANPTIQMDNTRVVEHPSLVSKGEEETMSDTVTVVNSLVEHVSKLPNNAPEHLRGLEIAEVCTISQVRSILMVLMETGYS